MLWVERARECSSRQRPLYNSAVRLLMRGYFRWQVGHFSITGRTLPTNPVSRFIWAEAMTRADIVCLRGAIDKGALLAGRVVARPST